MDIKIEMDMGTAGGSAKRSIATRYSGVVFRSQLEARWAVVFDMLGLEWEYEPCGFHVFVVERIECGMEAGAGAGAGVRYRDIFTYVPDFRIVDDRGEEIWIEIKGKEATQRQEFKCMMLSKGLGRRVVLLSGGFWDRPSGSVWQIEEREESEGVLIKWLKGGAELNDRERERVRTAYERGAGAEFKRAGRKPNRRPKVTRQIKVTIG